MSNAEQLRDLLAIMHDKRRLRAQKRILAQQLQLYGQDGKRMMREELARGLADHMVKVGELEKVFTAPMPNEAHPIDDAAYEQWDIEMVVMTKGEFRALNELCRALMDENRRDAAHGALGQNR